METSLTRIRWSRRSRGPEKASSSTGGSALASASRRPSRSSSFTLRAPISDRLPHALHRLLGHGPGLLIAGVQHLAHDVPRSEQALSRRLADRRERRLHVREQVPLAVHAAAGGRAALPVHHGDLVGRRVELVEAEDAADVRVARVLAADARRVRDHRHDLLPQRVGRLGHPDRVVVRLGHLPPVHAVQLRGRREERLRLGEDLGIKGVEAPHDLPGDLEMARLVLPHRHQLRAVERDVCGHQHRVTEEAVRRRGRASAARRAGPCTSARARATPAA